MYRCWCPTNKSRSGMYDRRYVNLLSPSLHCSVRNTPSDRTAARNDRFRKAANEGTVLMWLTPDTEVIKSPVRQDHMAFVEWWGLGSERRDRLWRPPGSTGPLLVMYNNNNVDQRCGDERVDMWVMSGCGEEVGDCGCGGGGEGGKWVGVGGSGCVGGQMGGWSCGCRQWMCGWVDGWVDVWVGVYYNYTSVASDIILYAYYVKNICCCCKSSFAYLLPSILLIKWYYSIKRRHRWIHKYLYNLPNSLFLGLR